MALFFDKAWFDAALAARGLDWATLAAAAGLSADDMTRIVKDERDVAPAEATAFAALLGAEPAEVARRCGVTTRAAVTSGAPKGEAGALAARLDRIEAKLDRLLAAVERISPR